VFAQLFVDELDDLAFPRRGGFLRVRVSAALEALGSGTEYEQVSAEGALAGSKGRTTGILGAMLATTGRSNAPLESRFRLGGLVQLSGLEQDELLGQHSLLVRAVLYRRFTNLRLLPIHAGVSGELGNVFPSRSEIGLARGIGAGSAFLGVDTPLGPLSLGYGFAEGGRVNHYLTLGQPLVDRRPGFRLR
jgi:NTE family protein